MSNHTPIHLRKRASKLSLAAYRTSDKQAATEMRLAADALNCADDEIQRLSDAATDPADMPIPYELTEPAMS